MGNAHIYSENDLKLFWFLADFECMANDAWEEKYRYHSKWFSEQEYKTKVSSMFKVYTEG